MENWTVCKVCRLCNAPFDLEHHIPVLLECSHYFGAKCIKKEADSKTFLCKECGTRIDVSHLDDRRLFPVLPFAIDLVNKEKSVCSICCKNASCYCSACNSWMCFNCLSRHQRIKFKIYHQTFTFAPHKEEKNEEMFVQTGNQCDLHLSENLDFFCKTCKYNVCCRCINEQHLSHEFTLNTKEYYEFSRQNLSKRMEQLGDYIKHHKPRMERVQSLDDSRISTSRQYCRSKSVAEGSKLFERSAFWLYSFAKCCINNSFSMTDLRILTILTEALKSIANYEYGDRQNSDLQITSVRCDNFSNIREIN